MTGLEEKFERVILTTADGSHTLFVPSMNEHYHSYHGAIEESKYVYIQQGLMLQVEKGYREISVLEIGLGTGLNVILTSLAAEELALPVSYISLEAFPLNAEEYNSLNYPSLLDNDKAWKEFDMIHQSAWDEPQRINDYFALTKCNTRLEDFMLEADSVDVVYFDAFAPNKQPELWSEEIFRAIYKMMSPGAVLVTYCAKAEVRRTMQAVGFEVERLPGPPHKREMLRANKK